VLQAIPTSATRPLKSLTKEEVVVLLHALGLPMYANDFLSEHVDGETLGFCENIQDISAVVPNME